MSEFCGILCLASFILQVGMMQVRVIAGHFGTFVTRNTIFKKSCRKKVNYCFGTAAFRRTRPFLLNTKSERLKWRKQMRVFELAFVSLVASIHLRFRSSSEGNL